MNQQAALMLAEHGNGPGRGHKRDDNVMSFQGTSSEAKEQLNKSLVEVKASAEAAPISAKNGEIGRGRDSCNNVTPIRGNSQSYLARRLRRDHLETYPRGGIPRGCRPMPTALSTHTPGSMELNG